MIYEASLQIPEVAPYMRVFSCVGKCVDGFSLRYMWPIWCFSGGSNSGPRSLQKLVCRCFSGPFFLAMLSLILGLLPQSLLQPYLQAAISVIRPEHLDFKISLWHGFNQVLLLSVITVVAGVVLFALHRKVIPLFVKFLQLHRYISVFG